MKQDTVSITCFIHKEAILYIYTCPRNPFINISARKKHKTCNPPKTESPTVRIVTLNETNSKFTPENWWLEGENFTFAGPSYVDGIC